MQNSKWRKARKLTSGCAWIMRAYATVHATVSLSSKEDFFVEAQYFDSPGRVWEGIFLTPDYFLI